MGKGIFLRKVIDLALCKTDGFNSTHTRKLYVFYFIALFALTYAVSAYQPSNAYAMTSSGLLVPLYSYPGTTWNELIQEKNNHNSIPVIAIINPSNGPGVKDENYVTGVHNLQNAGMVVLGYVDTGYGSRNATAIESEIDSYKNWYGVNGIFFDAMSYVHGNETYYKQLSNYTKSIGLTYTMGNPGADTLPSYVGTVGNIVIHDKKDLPPLSFFEGWHENFTKSNFSFVSYGVSNINRTFITNATKYVQYLYVTDLTLPNPFLDLPNYMDKLMGIIEAGGQNDGTVSVKVNAYSNDDKPLDGFWITVKSDTNSSSGFSPLSFNAIAGQQYTITVANFGNYTFEHWDDGTTKNTRTIVPMQNFTLTAYYGTNSTMTNRIKSSDLSDQTRTLSSAHGPSVSSHSIITSQVKNTGSVIVNVMYPDGDRADYTLLSFKIYQDTNQTLYRQIDSVSGNPFYIGDLPLNHRYKVEVFTNGMCADIQYVDLEKPSAQLNMHLPLPVGMRLQIFYNDGVTPIYNANVNVTSQDNKTWATGPTDTNGETLRFWLEPTTVNAYYIIDVKIDQNISFSYSPVFLYPGYATVSGYDSEIKITAPWPPPINNAIDVKVYDTRSQLYSSRSDNLMVGIFDSNGDSIAKSPVTPRGDAYFTNLKVGDYVLRALDMQNGTTWGESQIILDGKKTTFTIYGSQPAYNNQTSVASTNPSPKTSPVED